MIIYFTRNETYINTDNVRKIRNGESGEGTHRTWWFVFSFDGGDEYKHVFWEKENYYVAVTKIREAFKNNKKYVELDG